MDSLRSPFGRLRRLSPLRGSVELPTRGFSVIGFDDPACPKITREQVMLQICDPVDDLV